MMRFALRKRRFESAIAYTVDRLDEIKHGAAVRPRRLAQSGMYGFLTSGLVMRGAAQLPWVTRQTDDAEVVDRAAPAPSGWSGKMLYAWLIVKP